MAASPPGPAKEISHKKDSTGRRKGEEWTLRCTKVGQHWAKKINHPLRKLYIHPLKGSFQVGTHTGRSILTKGGFTYRQMNAGMRKDLGDTPALSINCTRLKDGEAKIYIHAEWEGPPRVFEWLAM